MFDPNNAVRLSIPQWQAVYKAEIQPGVFSFIAIHDTTRGASLGGCRMAQYSDLAEALTDVLRLSRGMTFKNAIADLPLGGGKALIVCDPKVDGQERERILENFGRFLAWVNSEEDIYYSAEDMNTTVADMHVVKRHTKNLYGLEVDPSPYTAWGVYASIAYTVSFFAADLFGGDGNLKDKRVLVQGLGKVGTTLVDYLHKAGATLYVSDIREEALSRIQSAYPGVTAVAPGEIYDVEVDVFAPCAGGELVTRKTIDHLKFKVLCGAANNQLQNTRIGWDLHAKGIVYCPDYIVNMGGVCGIQYSEIDRLSHEETIERIQQTVDRRLDLTFRTAFSEELPFNVAVDHAVKQIVWGNKGKNIDFSNARLFPIAFTSKDRG